MNTFYLDLWDNPAELNEEEIQWFEKICKDCMEATGMNIPIICDDHSTYKGKSKEALGIFHTTNIEKPLCEDCKISIDTYFIHECYEELFHGKRNLTFDNLEHVIAHEFAHAFQWRHGKRHKELTEEFYRKIKSYQEKEATS